MSNVFSSGMWRWILVIAFAMPPATAPASAAHAQTAQPRRLTLSAAIERARQHHPLIIAAGRRVAIAEAEKLESSLRPNPSLTVSGENFPIGSAPKGFEFGSGT